MASDKKGKKGKGKGKGKNGKTAATATARKAAKLAKLATVAAKSTKKGASPTRSQDDKRRSVFTDKKTSEPVAILSDTIAALTEKVGQQTDRERQRITQILTEKEKLQKLVTKGKVTKEQMTERMEEKFAELKRENSRDKAEALNKLAVASPTKMCNIGREPTASEFTPMKVGGSRLFHYLKSSFFKKKTNFFKQQKKMAPPCIFASHFYHYYSESENNLYFLFFQKIRFSRTHIITTERIQYGNTEYAFWGWGIKYLPLGTDDEKAVTNKSGKRSKPFNFSGQ